jgi:hypothetical protein
MMKILRMFNPTLYQGAAKRSSYFEGWYFKQTSNAAINAGKAAQAVSFIPGISRAKAGSGSGDRAFVQMIDGATGMTRFFPFPVEEFSVQDKPFRVTVGRNHFSLAGLSVDLQDSEGTVKAELAYGPVTGLSRKSPWPGIMGPYSFVPFMECYHGLVSLDHRVDGFVTMNGVGSGAVEQTVKFSGGRGYIEKDWGRSMPRSWVWVQSNTFDPAVGPASFFFSLARIPWLGSWFNGFLAVLYAGGVEYRFASYTGAKVKLLSFDGSTVSVLVVDRNRKLEVSIRRNHEGALAAPVDGALDRRISESADSWVRVVLKQRHGGTDLPLFDAASAASGVEIVGDVGSLRP